MLASPAANAAPVAGSAAGQRLSLQVDSGQGLLCRGHDSFGGGPVQGEQVRDRRGRLPVSMGGELTLAFHGRDRGHPDLFEQPPERLRGFQDR